MLVVVVSMLNTAPLPIKSIVLQAAVPKVPVPGFLGPPEARSPLSRTRCLQQAARPLWPLFHLRALAISLQRSFSPSL